MFIFKKHDDLLGLRYVFLNRLGNLLVLLLTRWKSTRFVCTVKDYFRQRNLQKVIMSLNIRGCFSSFSFMVKDSDAFSLQRFSGLFYGT